MGLGSAVVGWSQLLPELQTTQHYSSTLNVYNLKITVVIPEKLATTKDKDFFPGKQIVKHLSAHDYMYMYMCIFLK